MPKSTKCTFLKEGTGANGTWKLYEIECDEAGETKKYNAFEPIEKDEEFVLVDGKDGKKRATKPKPQSGGKFPMKDYTFDKRKASLDASIAWLKGNEKSKKEHILELAEVFYQYLNKK